MVISRNKVLFILIILTMFCYIFRGVTVSYGFSFIPYVLTVLLLGVFLFKKKYCHLDSSVSCYVIVGIIMTFCSFFIINNNSIIASISGFLVLFSNYLLWVLIIRSLKKEETTLFYDNLCYFIFICAVVSGLLAIYQIFVDTTVFGFAQSGIYSDEEAMSSGRYQSRATALFTSAQNYGFYMGMAFCLGITNKFNNKFIWIVGMLIILLGIVVSNSRSASACVVISLGLGAFNSLITSKKPLTSIFIYSVTAIVILLFLLYLINSEYGLLFERLLQFNNSESQIVYDKTLNQFNTVTCVTGLGMGYRSWTVNSLLGPDMYRLCYGEDYYSVESFFLNLLVQGGIFLLLSFVIVVIKALRKSFKNGTLSIIVCMIVNMVYTPSMSGLALSFIFWPFLLRELVIYKYSQ